MINSISVVFEVYNAQEEIEEAIQSAKLLTEKIVVIDLSSTDKTALLAKACKVKVISEKFSQPVEKARNLAFQTDTTWVLLLDADERLTPELAGEIKKAINSNQYTHYKIPRKNIFAHQKWLKHGGWYPDEQIRLIKKEAFINWPETIHSTPIIKGEMGHLKESFWHYFHPNLENMVEKTIIFENQEAQLLFEAKRKVSILIFFRKALGELYRRLFKQAGFKDQTFGVIESVYQAYSKTITYLFLYEKKVNS